MNPGNAARKLVNSLCSNIERLLAEELELRTTRAGITLSV